MELSLPPLSGAQETAAWQGLAPDLFLVSPSALP